ncbi:cupin domain-containing protein [Salegentibacter salegens]|uniref:Cupin domain-containing protein n=1 Tax=Salegentibacter salegens TaxID=143223 RepID=A0A1M7KUG3_9FLAO|nr:cupin domain-containing protein [Salegentibacter salegens]PRX43813.1 Cupin domain-containing protein [Salegentibacter salegens]SHM69129.1 Cupin domain-containing protein [Salegentibacter salegens]
MKNASLTKDLEYNGGKPAVKVLMDTSSSREIRIVMRKGQVMKEHKTPFPIVVEIFEGEITFGVNRETHTLVKGDLVYLEGNVPHDLKAEKNSTVRLTLSKSDTAERVKEVADSST